MDSLTFQFHDGTTLRYADPLVVLNRLLAKPDYRPAMIDEAIGGDAASVMSLSEIVRDVFGIQHLSADGRGLTRLGCVQLIHRFDRWVAQLRNTSGIQ